MYHNELDPPSFERATEIFLAKVERQREEDERLRADLEYYRDKERWEAEEKRERESILSNLAINQSNSDNEDVEKG